MVAKQKTFFTNHPSLERQRKNLLFLNLIKTRRSLSRTEISRLIEINIVTVSNYINGYLKKGLVVECGQDFSSGGRKPELLELNKGWGYVVGLDVGEGYVKGVLVNLNMDILAERTEDFPDGKNVENSVSEIIEHLAGSAKTEKNRIRKIGITISKMSKSPEFLRKMQNAREEKSTPQFLFGDCALCAASGEMALNSEIMDEEAVLYTYSELGRGVFIKDREFYYEAEDVADTKFFHKTAYLEPWKKSHCIANVARRMIAGGIHTKMFDLAEGNVKGITRKIAIKAAEEGDEAAMDIINAAGANLGMRIAYLVNLLGPGHVVVGGGVEEAGGLFFNALKATTDKFLSKRVSDKVKIMPAVLGKDTCVKGAAFLAVREALMEA